MRHFTPIFCTLSTFWLLGCSEKHKTRPLARPVAVRVDPQSQAVARQMAQTEAERRLIRKTLTEEKQPCPVPPPLPPSPNEEEMRIAGELIRQHYQQIHRMPSRDELIVLLTEKMNLGTENPQQRAGAILDLMMID